MLTREELKKEQDYLEKVHNILTDEIKGYDEKVKFLSNNIQEQMTYAWDKTNRLSDTEFVYALANIQKRSVYAENASKKMRAFNKMLGSAYFARIDFVDGEGTTPIYIGISSLEHNLDFYVYDWRAPISSMFYNFEVGDASYEISNGEKIVGKITLKRQFKISGTEIKEVFDTDMQIIDSILKEILSKNTSPKMKNIVNTIQKEQNLIIRDNKQDVLIVQGPAGCGKTSIAMHKIAFLLYSERNIINNSNIMILSPNDIFNNYISDVLPEIGEDNVAQATFFEFAKAYITEMNIVSRIEDIYEVVYGEDFSKQKYEEIKLKFDPFYCKAIVDFIDENKFDFLAFEDIVINDEIVMSAKEMKPFADEFKLGNESLYVLAKKIIEKIFFETSKKTVKHLTLEKIKQETLTNLSKLKIKIADFYKLLYSDKDKYVAFMKNECEKYNYNSQKYNFESIFDETNKFLKNNSLEYQEIAPFMFFKSKIIGITPNKNIKYVLIDEAQDYSYAQYCILSLLFKNSSVTVLGDLNQTILPFFRHKNYNTIAKLLCNVKPKPSSKMVTLKKTYRSTFEINEFAKKILTENNCYTQIDRHGDEVEIEKQENFDAEEIMKQALKLKNSYNTVAIICKNTKETLKYNELISKEEYLNKFRLVTKNDNVFVSEKIMIIPSYLSKGLEFDAVLVSNANSENYSSFDKNLLYVVLTRALHKLKIFYTKELTELISGENNGQNS